MTKISHRPQNKRILLNNVKKSRRCRVRYAERHQYRRTQILPVGYVAQHGESGSHKSLLKL